MIGQLYIIEQVGYPFLSLPTGNMMKPRMKLQVLGDSQVFVQAKMLLNYTEFRLYLEGFLTTSKPLMSTFPEVGLVSVVRIRMVVVFPAPFGPGIRRALPVQPAGFGYQPLFFQNIPLSHSKYLSS